jgi:hypothetical protein
MDLTHDNFLVQYITFAIKAGSKAAPVIAKNTRDRAKSNEAQKISDKGQYWTLRPYLKSLIYIPDYVYKQVLDKNISYFAVLQLPAQTILTPTNTIIKKLQNLTENPILEGVSGLASEAWTHQTIKQSVPDFTFVPDFKKGTPTQTETKPTTQAEPNNVFDNLTNYIYKSIFKS